MRRAADVFHPQLFDCTAAVGQGVSCTHGDVSQVPRDLDRVRCRGREWIEFIVNYHDGLEGVYLLEV